METGALAEKIEQEVESKRRLLSLDDILAAKDITIEPVDVPGWGGRIFVRSLSGRDKEKYIGSIRRVIGEGKDQKIELKLEGSEELLLAWCLCDEEGNPSVPRVPPHGIPDPVIVERFREKGWQSLRVAVDKAAQINGLNETAEEKVKNVSASQTVNFSSNSV